jgi:hypothetical protein
MRSATAHCTRLELFGDRVRIHFESDLVPRPGQFLLARLAPVYDPYLRQALFPSKLATAGFTVDLPAASPVLGFVAPGAIVDVIGPAGAAPPEIPSRSRVVLIARDPPALLPFAARAIDSGGAATLLVSDPYPLEALDPQIELRVGDLPSLAAEFGPLADLVFMHVTAALRRTLHTVLSDSRAAVAPAFAHALCPLPMPCGTGACGACYIKTARGHRLACLDGPFFSLAELE